MLAGLLVGSENWKQVAVARAQEVYDAWQQDPDGIDEVYGAGGICDDIAQALADSLVDAGFEAFTFHYESDNHTVAVALMQDRTVEVDIPLHIYEIGSWYNYKKRLGVQFTASQITLVELGGRDQFESMQES